MKLFEDIKKIFSEDCVISGTSFTDKGVTVSIQRKKSEDFLFYRIDDCLIRDNFTRKSDLFIACSQKTEVNIIFVCEMKGRHIEKACKQIIETLKDERFKEVLNIIPKNFIKIALIASGGGSQKPLQKYKEDLKRNFGFKTEIKTVTTKGYLDLRPIITKNLK